MMRSVLVTVFTMALIVSAQSQRGISSSLDSLRFARIMETSQQKLWQEFLPGDIVASVAREFIGSPYAPSTLDAPGKEHLVINLHSFDCVTLVENVLAITRCIQTGKQSFESLKDNVRTIRYRDGTLRGYPSRLHYFSEWLDNNGHKGFVHDITRDLGGIPLEKKIDWMTKHRESYWQLQDSVIFRDLAAIERRLSATRHFYLPAKKIRDVESLLHSGDIIAVVSSKEGLDVAHVGIAVRMDDGGVHYLHAPDVNGVVKITDEPLGAYISRHTAFSGIMVARPTGEVQDRK